MLWWRLGWQDILRHKRFAFFFIINLSLGLIGFILISSLSSSFGRYLEDNLREILTADLMVYSSKPLTFKEQAQIRLIIDNRVERARQVSMYSMVKTQQTSRLARIIAVDDSYPLYGRFTFADPQTAVGQISEMQNRPVMFLSGEAAETLQVSPGEMVSIGKVSFEVGPYLADTPGNDFTAVELAPNIYIGLPQLERSGLIQFGSRAAYIEYFRMDPNTPVREIATKLKGAFDATAGGDSALLVYTIHDVNRQLGRLSGYFFGYVGLVGVVALFLAGIAASYLFRGYFQSRIQETAILMSLGAKRRHCVLLFLTQLACMGVASALVAIAAAMVILPFIPSLPLLLLPQEATFKVTPASMLIAVTIGICSSFLFCIPVLTRLANIKPLLLLRNTLSPSDRRITARLKRALSLLPAIVFFAVLSTLLTGSLTRGTLFTGGVFLVILFFGLFGIILFQGCRYLSGRTQGLLKIALRNLYRNRFFSNSVFITIATGVFLMNLIPQIQKGLQEEISRPKDIRLPVFFLMDIQEEQQQPLLDFMSGHGAALSPLAPMVHGRIDSVNSIPFNEYKQLAKLKKKRGRIRRTEFIFSSRKQLDASESIIQGRRMTTTPWQFDSGLPFEISVADHFRQRYALQLGDSIVFNIQGIKLEGKIVNFRKVRWNSFQPNFFLLFQQGVLDDAPKTFLASVSKVAPAEKQELKNNLVQRFANISVLDVSKTVKTLLDFSNKLSFAIRSMAFLAIAAGLTAIFSIARNEARIHEKEINLLKVLGARFSDVRTIVLLEFGYLGTMATVFSLLLSTGCSYLLSWHFFDRLWLLDFSSIFFILLGTIAVCMTTALVAADSVIKKKAASLLH